MILRLLLLGLAGVFLLVMLSVLFDFTEPYLFPLHLVQGTARQASNNVIVGPYPQKEDLKRLKARFGVVEVINLMSPDIPFERGLIEREHDNAAELGLKYNNFPMSFILLRNDSNLNTAKAIAKYVAAKYGKQTRDKIYINCYLGRHRVSLVYEAINSPATTAKVSLEKINR